MQIRQAILLGVLFFGLAFLSIDTPSKPARHLNTKIVKLARSRVLPSRGEVREPATLPSLEGRQEPVKSSTFGTSDENQPFAYGNWAGCWDTNCLNSRGTYYVASRDRSRLGKLFEFWFEGRYVVAIQLDIGPDVTTGRDWDFSPLVTEKLLYRTDAPVYWREFKK